MAELKVTELDFFQIKENLRNFLKAQDEFTDYNFDGSAISLLIETLAYNTHYNAMLAHLVGNEMFIDTAIKRSSVVSIAKSLGYTPKSMIAPRAVVNLVVTPSDPGTTQLTLSQNNSFTTSINGRTYTFFVDEEQTVNQADGVFTFNNVSLIEGTRLSNSFTVLSDVLSGPFEIPDIRVDLNTLRVQVQKSSGEIEIETFERAHDALNVSSDSAVFWVEETMNGTYQILFGDGVLGRKLDVGNIVYLFYMTTSGPEANGARSFTLAGPIDGETAVSIELVNIAAAGQDRESIDSIRFNAVRHNKARSRVVTSDDYQTIILGGFDKAKAVTVWGGEQNDPPIYGKVFITIDPRNGYVITDADKDYIVNTLLKPRSVVSLQHEFVDPEYLYITLDVRVSYDPRLSTMTASEVSTSVREEIRDWFSNQLSTLEKTFFYSHLIDRIDNSNSSVIGSVVEMWLQRRFRPTIGEVIAVDAHYLTSIQPRSVESAIFTTTINTIQSQVQLQDNGAGVLRLISSTTGAVLLQNAGTVDYAGGVVEVRNVPFSGFVGGMTDFRISVKPEDLGKNITPSVVRTSEVSENSVTASPARNMILVLDDSTSIPFADLRPGLNVTSAPFYGN